MKILIVAMPVNADAAARTQDVKIHGVDGKEGFPGGLRGFPTCGVAVEGVPVASQLWQNIAAEQLLALAFMGEVIGEQIADLQRPYFPCGFALTAPAK